MEVLSNSLIEEASANGSFILYRGSADPLATEALCFLPETGNHVAVYRINACFMEPRVLRGSNAIPAETQFILSENEGIYTLYYALADAGARTSFFEKEGKLSLKIDTGDTYTPAGKCRCAYVCSGHDPYVIFGRAAEDLCGALQGLKLLRDKELPDFVNRLGFCTYNAFYDNISEKKLCDFIGFCAEKGVKFGFMIIDCGWQTVKDTYMQTFFADKSKFPNGLLGFTQKLKVDFGLDNVIAWHTFYGYWTGLSADIGYETVHSPFVFPPEYLKEPCSDNGIQNTIGAEEFYPCNLYEKDCIYTTRDTERFYDDFYAYLSECGIKGTKIDALGWIEVFGEGNGGRAALQNTYVRAISGSSKKYFANNSIYCSSNNNDFLYHSYGAAVIRSCKDYLPEDRGTHGTHILSNAHNALWLGEFFMCDFDMFQTGREEGLFHAVQRVISGGPIYVADNAETINFDILKALSASDGFVPICDGYPKITTDCLFINPVAERRLFKQVNRYKNTLLLAVFNCRREEERLCETVILKSVFGVAEGRYAAYSYHDGFMGVYAPDEEIAVCLGGLDAELISFVKIEQGTAVLGLQGKFMPSAFAEASVTGASLSVALREKGTLLIYTERVPKDCSQPYKISDNLFVCECTQVVLKF